MRKFILFFVLLFTSISTTLSAQPMFEKGTIVDNSGEEKNVLVDISNFFVYPSEIIYKVSKSTSMEIVSPSDIQSVRVSKVRFVSFNDKIHLNDEIDSSSDPNFEPTSIFLKQLSSGSINLFEYKVGGSNYFFIQTEDSEILQLLSINFKRPDGIVSVKSEFRNQLKNALPNKCCYTDNEIANLKYESRSIKEFVHNYNVCDGSIAEQFSNPSILDFKYLNIGLTASVSSYSILSYFHLNNVKESSFEGTQFPLLGAEIEYLLPFMKNKFSIWGNINYRKITGVDYDVITLGAPDTARLHYETLETAIGARWYINSSNVAKFYTDLGYSKPYEVGEGISIKYDRKANFEDKNLTPHFILGAGVLIKNRFAVDARLEYYEKSISNVGSTEDVTINSITLNFKVFLKSYY